MKKGLLLLLLCMVILSACKGTKKETSAVTEVSSVKDGFVPSEKVDRNIKTTLVFASYDGNVIKLMEEALDIEKRFQKYYPNVSIEIEQSKNDTEYWQSMTIRASAGELPDIMYNKPFTLSRFQDYLLDLNAACAGAIANNTQAKGYALNGKVLGIPEKSGNDYVFYWTDLFEEAGVKVPETWTEFVEACKTLQTYFGAKDPDFAALAIGAKDEWPTYPFTEFMPGMINGKGDTWDIMATQDRPFAEGTDVNICYQKLYDLFSSGVCGRDPLGIGQDQAVGLFGQKKAAIIVSGAWCLDAITQATDSTDGIKTFYLPARNKSSDIFWLTTQGDNMVGVSTQSKNPDLALEFINFYFSADWYADLIVNIADDSTMKNFPKVKNPILANADTLMPNPQFALYNGGGPDFLALQAETKFDYKKLGSQMFAPGFNLESELSRLNDSWTAARAKLGIGK
jgi:raffinose/stachyose/melibiose transport system substrate-binding protein